MDNRTFDWKEWFLGNKGNLMRLALVLVVGAFMVFTGQKLSDVENDVKNAYSPLRPYLPEETQAKIDDLLANWDEIEGMVMSFEEWFGGLDDIEAQGITNLDQLYLKSGGTGTTLLVNHTGTGTIVDFQDGGSSVWSIADGGAVTAGGTWDLNGQKLDIDADADTSMTADTDDQVDWEIGGADVMVWTDFGASDITTDTTINMVEILDSTPVMTGGTNILSALNIDLGIGNSTGGTNTVNAIRIDGVTQDAQNTEAAVYIGNGWDRGLDMDGNSIYLDNDQDTIIAEASDDLITLTPGAATGSFEVRTGNLQVGNGTPGETHDGEDFYCEGISEFDGTAYFDGAVDMDSTLDVDSTANLDEVDVDGVLNLVVNTEHIGALSVITTAITYTAGAGGTGVVATIGDGEIWLVYSVFWQNTTNFDCTGDDCTATVGDGNDADGFMVLADANMQTTFTEATGFAAGFYGIENGSQGAYTLDDGGPFLYAPSGAAETIDWALAAAGDDFAAGAATIYVVYMRIQ